MTEDPNLQRILKQFNEEKGFSSQMEVKKTTLDAKLITNNQIIPDKMNFNGDCKKFCVWP